MKCLALLRVLGLKVFFPLGPTGYQWSVGTNSLKYVMKKKLICHFQMEGKLSTDISELRQSSKNANERRRQ